MTHVGEMLEAVDLFIAPSHFLRDFFIAHGVPADRIIYSDNGMQVAHFAGFRREPSDQLRFGFIGTLIPSKGVHILIEAFNPVPPNRARLLIFGVDVPFDGWPGYDCDLRRMATNPSIAFMGGFANEQVADVLSSIDVLVVPSIWYENSPLTIHEAFLARIPVIAANLGGMAEYVHHMHNGLLFRPRDPADLRTQMMKLIENPGLLEVLRTNIPAVKSIAENAAEMEELYSRVNEVCLHSRS